MDFAEKATKRLNSEARKEVDGMLAVLRKEGKTGKTYYSGYQLEKAHPHLYEILKSGIICKFTENVNLPVERSDGMGEANVDVRFVAATHEMFAKFVDKTVPAFCVFSEKSLRKPGGDFERMVEQLGPFVPTVFVDVFGSGHGENLMYAVCRAMETDPDALFCATRDEIDDTMDDAVGSAYAELGFGDWRSHHAAMKARADVVSNFAKFLFRPTTAEIVSHEIMHVVDHIGDTKRSKMDDGTHVKKGHFKGPEYERWRELFYKDIENEPLTPEEEKEYKELERKKHQWEDREDERVERESEKAYWKRPSEVNARVQGFISGQVGKARRLGYDSVTLASMRRDMDVEDVLRGVTEHQRRRILSSLPDILDYVRRSSSVSSKDLEDRRIAAEKREAELARQREELDRQREAARRMRNAMSLA